MSNLNYSVLGLPNLSYHFKLKIFNPFNNSLYKTWITDKVSLEALTDAIGEISSIVGSTNLEASPVNLNSLITIPFEKRLIYSRQIQGWPVIVNVVTVGLNPSDDADLQIFKGIIGKIETKGNTSSVEVVSNYEQLKQPSRYKLSTSCTREFGDLKCGVNRETALRTVISLVDYELQINAPITLTSPFQYEVTIGDDNYLIVSYDTFTDTIELDRKPLARPDSVVIRKSCDRKLGTCKAYGNNINFLGVVGLPSNSLSIRL
jgi:hypothetical protein